MVALSLGTPHGLDPAEGRNWYFQFGYHGSWHTFTIGKVTEEEARATSAQVDSPLMRLRQQLVELPSGVDIIAFIQETAGRWTPRSGRWTRLLGRPAPSPGRATATSRGTKTLSSTFALSRSPIAQKNLENSVISTF